MISLGIFGIDSAVLAIVALLTGAGLVALAMWLAGLFPPVRSTRRRVRLMSAVSRRAVSA